MPSPVSENSSTEQVEAQVKAMVCEEVAKTLICGGEKVLPEADIKLRRDDFAIAVVPEFVWGNRDMFVGGSIEPTRFIYERTVGDIYSREGTYKKIGFLTSVDGKGKELRGGFGSVGAFSPDGISGYVDLLLDITTKVGKDGATGNPYVGAMVSLGVPIYAIRPDPWNKSSGFFLRFEPVFGLGGGADIVNSKFNSYFDIEGSLSTVAGLYF